MTQKKTPTTFTQKLHILAQNVSDSKIIVGAVVVVLGTLVSVAFGAINYAIAAKNAPIITRVEAIESKQILFEQALVDFKSNNTDQHKTLDSKLDTLLFKLIPNYRGGDNISN